MTSTEKSDASHPQGLIQFFQTETVRKYYVTDVTQTPTRQLIRVEIRLVDPAEASLGFDRRLTQRENEARFEKNNDTRDRKRKLKT